MTTGPVTAIVATRRNRAPDAMTTTVHPTPASRLAELRDATRVLLRRQTPADRALIAEFFAGLSAQSRYLRFGTGMPPELPRRYLDLLSDVDGDVHVGIVAIHRGRIVGAARYVRRRDLRAEAEVAVTVTDAFQRRGLGRLLLDALRDDAARHGIERLTSETLASNRGARALARSLGAEPAAHGYALTSSGPAVAGRDHTPAEPVAA